MEILNVSKTFDVTNNEDLQGKDFSYHLFENLSSEEMKNISFFRCDFRGAHFNNVNFYKNDLDRADFISCIFEDCTFSEVNIAASEMKNCIFKQTTFSYNKYDNTSIQECFFDGCSFKKEHLLVNMKNTHFLDTSFSEVSFERSTTELDTFERCALSDVDFATMHAECHRFISCTLDRVKLGISYVFGYLYYNTSITSFEVLYRGEQVNLNNEHEARKRLEKNRLYEMLNILFIYNKHEKIPSFFEYAISELIQNYNVQVQLELVNIFNAIIFYTNYRVIPYKVMMEIAEFLKKMDFSVIPFPSEMQIIGLKEQFFFLIQKLVLDNNCNQDLAQEYALLHLHLNTNDYEQAINISNDFFDKLSNLTGKQLYFELYETKQGSWILVYLISVATLFIIPKVIKEYSNLIFSLEIKHAYVKQAVSKLNQKRLPTEKMLEIAETYEKMSIDDSSSIDVAGLISEVKGFL